jgi:hypothetical protein
MRECRVVAMVIKLRPLSFTNGISQCSKPNLSNKDWNCHDPSLGLATKPRGCKVAGQEGDLGVTLHAPRSAKSVREWTLTLPSELPLWELESRMGSRIFKAWLQGSKPIGLKSSLYHWKDIEMQMSKMGWHYSFGHLKHKLWPKEGPGVKLAIWLSTTKSLESTWFTCV